MEVNESKIRIFKIKIFLLTILTIGCFYLIIKNFLYYFEYNVSTNINSINEIPLVFPAVSVCSYTSNLIDKKSIIKLTNPSSIDEGILSFFIFILLL